MTVASFMYPCDLQAGLLGEETQVSAEVSQGLGGKVRDTELTSDTLVCLPHFHLFYLSLTKKERKAKVFWGN